MAVGSTVMAPPFGGSLLSEKVSAVIVAERRLIDQGSPLPTGRSPVRSGLSAYTSPTVLLERAWALGCNIVSTSHRACDGPS